MNFIRQIKLEIRNILKSKFILIMAILIILAGAVMPLIGYLAQKNTGGGGIIEPTVRPYYARDMAYQKDIWYPGPIDDGSESITIDGITIYSDNPFFWNIKSLQNEKTAYASDKNPFSTPAALDLFLNVLDQEVKFYLGFAQHITTHQDYRVEMAWRGIESVYDKFFFEHNDEEESVLIEVAAFRRGVDPETFRSTYIDITAVEKLAGIDKADQELSMINDIVVNNDFAQYIALRIDMSNSEIAGLEENIAIQQAAIIENPSQEEYLNQIIEDLRRQIDNIRTNTIPILEYRLNKNILPGLDIWQNRALSDVENSRNQLAYLRILSEEEWNDNYYDKQQGQTYADYVASMQKQIDALNKTIIIAQKSLDADQPDMIYEPQGARNRTVEFLGYSTVVALFGVLLGGWLIASEYLQGTIRLLMIRPKTRTKILLSKFLAALLVWLAVDLIGSLLNLITNGILFGFADFAYPNYTVAGQINFFAFYLPKLLACMMPILFMFAIAFMLSVILKNTAVSIAVPVVLYIGSTIIMNIFAYQNGMDWLAYTPIPFMQMSVFFSRYSYIQYIIERGVNLNLTFGILQLLALSMIFTGIAAYVFKKRDIVN